jgi:PmbA protein
MAAMRKSGLDLARWVVARAGEHGASEAAATCYSDRSVHVEWSGGRIEQLQEGRRRGVSLSIYYEGRHSQHNTSDIREEVLERFTAQAVAVTRQLAPDPSRGLPDPKYYRGYVARDLGLVDPRHAELDAGERLRRVRALEAAARSESNRVIAVTASFGDSVSQTASVHSNGFEGESADTFFSIQAGVALADGDRRSEGFAYGMCRRLESLPSAEMMGREAVSRALRKVGQRKIASGEYDLLVENRAVRRLLTPLIGAMSGRALQQKSSFLEGMLGKPIASDILTLADDPLVPGGANSRLFDEDGLPAVKRTLIDRGVLRTLYIGNHTARKLGVEPTTGSPSNLVFQTGDHDLEDMIGNTHKGIVVTDFIGGDTNQITGDFSFGISGFSVLNGRLDLPVNEMNVSGNFKQFWKQLVAVGKDLFPHGVWATPCLRFHRVPCSGL